MNYVRLIYRSRAAGKLDCGVELPRILACSVRNNSPHGLTGALSFYCGEFVQVLEGRPGQIQQLLGVLARDTRHENMRILGRWGVSNRLFSGWSMAMARVGEASPRTRHLLQCEDRGLELVSVMFDLANRSPASI